MSDMKRLDVLLAHLPEMECKGLCQECCGPVGMSEGEYQRIVQSIGYVPKPDCSMTCPLLNKTTGRCTVYEFRPVICRLWGLVEAMKCPHGCKPKRWVSKAESYALLKAAEQIGGPARYMVTPEFLTKSANAVKRLTEQKIFIKAINRK